MPIPFGKIATLLGLSAVSVVVAMAIVKDPAQLMPGGGPGGRRGGPGGGGDMPVPVLAGEAKRADVPVTLEGVGTAKALNTVTVRPQIEGKLIAINFREGQTVKKGDVLAQIDTTLFQAQLDQAVAKKAVDATQLANARRDMERYAGLTTLAVSQKVSDTQKALVAQFEAQVKQDEAAIANVRAIFGYTDIKAPIDGRTGLRQMDVGNLVRASDTPIVVLTQLQPISVVFTLPQQQLAQVNRAMLVGPVSVEALDFDNKTVLDTGLVQVIDNQVDQTTGTVRLKADFPNDKMQLWPGQFANVRLLTETLKQVVVVPTPALQRGPNGSFVYVIGLEQKVTVRPVTLGLQTEQTAVVTAGVEPGERVVTTGFAKLKEGSRVLLGEPPPRPDRPTGGPPSAEGGAKRKRPPDQTSGPAGDAARPPVAADQSGSGDSGKRRGEGKRGDGWAKGDGRGPSQGPGPGRGENRPSQSEGRIPGTNPAAARVPPKAEVDTPARAVR